jgi:ElaA protein
MNRAPLDWRCVPFEELSVFELDAIYRARQQVFVSEQDCPYLDADGHDPACWHLAAWPPAAGVPWAYARIVRPGEKYPEPSIGRVLTTPPGRGIGLGRELVGRAVARCQALYPSQGIRIAAQSRLEVFYAGFGFVAVGVPFLEDGIDHTEMFRPG